MEKVKKCKHDWIVVEWKANFDGNQAQINKQYYKAMILMCTLCKILWHIN